MPELVEISDDEETQTSGRGNNKPAPPRVPRAHRPGASEDDPFVIDDTGAPFHKTLSKSVQQSPSTSVSEKASGQTSNPHPGPAFANSSLQSPNTTLSFSNPQSPRETLQARSASTMIQRPEAASRVKFSPSKQSSRSPQKSVLPKSPTQATSRKPGITLNGSPRKASLTSKDTGVVGSLQSKGPATGIVPTHSSVTPAIQTSIPTRSSVFSQSPPSKRKQQPLQNPLSALRKQTSISDLPHIADTARQNTNGHSSVPRAAQNPSRVDSHYSSRCLPCSASDLSCDGLYPCMECAKLSIQCVYVSHSPPRSKPLINVVEDMPRQQRLALPVIASSQPSRPASPPEGPPQTIFGSLFVDVESDEDNDSDSHHPSETDIVLELQYFENLINRLVQEMHTFQEYTVKPLLQQSRLASAIRNTAAIPQPKKSPFDALRPQSDLEGNLTAHLLQFQVKDYCSAAPSTKQKWSLGTAPITREKSIATFIPKYKSIGRLRASFLAPNLTTVKYNHYDFDDENYTWDMIESKYEEVKSRYHTYDKISSILHAQRECAEHADLWRPWTERLFDQLGLAMSDIVCFYSMDGSSETQWNETVGFSDELLAKWTNEQERECETCKERYDSERDTLRDAYKLQPQSSRQLALAGLACLAFHDVTGLSMSHIAMTSSWTRNMLGRLEGSRRFHGRSGPLMCLVCGLHNCHLHGAFQDDSGLPESFLDDLINYVKIDDAEAERNTRVMVALPIADKPNLQSSSSKQTRKKRTMKGLRKAKTELAKIEHRGLFIPCSHDGPCQDNSACSCFKSKISCEYICGCELTCQRRFKGCSCRTGTKEVCSNDASCECWNNSRECDPWLCKGCGVLEVLDQTNRYNEDIRRGRCYNNRIQLGIPARTIKAPSEVQGFGLFAGEDLEKGAFIGEYKGEIISQPESDRRGSLYPILGAEYLFTLNPTQQIDATSFGNKTRFMNNSLSPGNINVAGCVMLCNGVQRVMLYADRKIKAGEELLYNYDYPDHATKNFWERGEKAPTKRALIEAPVAKTAGTKKQQPISQPSSSNAQTDNGNEAVDSSRSPPLIRKGKRRFSDIGEVAGSESAYTESRQGSEASESDSGEETASSELDWDISTRINKLGKPDRRFGGAAQRKAAQTRVKKLAEQVGRR